MKLLTTEENGVAATYVFDCPGCKCSHEVYVRPHISPNGASWDFNGDMESPTFTPSILSKVSRPDGSKTMVCHLFVTDGKIQYLTDCTHELAGQTVDLPDVD